MRILDIKKDLTEMGLGDNLNLAVLIYLAATARKTCHKFSVLVSGPAGLGKSHLAKTVLSLFPKDDIITNSRITPAGLMGMEDLSSKILFIYERFHDAQFAQYVRELMSEGEVVYTTANGVQRLKGPVTLIETTVNLDTLGTENRSRCFVVSINSSDEAKTGICEKVKTARTVQGLMTEESKKKLLETHRLFQQGLDSSVHVVIPYAREIRFKASPYHAPRIIQRVLNVVSAIAFLDQHNRERRTHEGVQYIEATRDDFEDAKQLFVNLEIDEEEFLFAGDIMEFIEFLRSEREKLCQKGKFTRNDIVELQDKKGKNWSYKVIAKHLRHLCHNSLVDMLQVRGTKNSVEYRLSKDFIKTAFSPAPLGCYSTLSLP